MLIDVDALLAAYHDVAPDPAEPAQRVSFGTSGHRGTARAGTFNEAHVLAISEAICRYRAAQGIDGPLFLGRDTHALSEPAAAHRGRGADRPRRRGPGRRGRRPHADARHLARHPHPQRRRRRRRRPTASSSPPRTTRPRTAASSTTRRAAGRPTRASPRWIQDEANRLLEGGLAEVRAPRRRRGGTRRTTTSPPTSATSATSSTWTRSATPGVSLGVDPLGGASAPYWAADRRALRARPDRGQRRDRPDLPLRARSTTTARSAWTARRRTRWPG